MNYIDEKKPSKLNLDKSKKSLLPNESAFLKNHEVNNPSAQGKATPMAANYLACDLETPAGENYAPNNHYSVLTNENYTWHFNSNGVHFISRIKGDGNCEIVYADDCLKLSADPQHQITQFRAILDVDFLCNKVPGGKLKRLVWTDGTDTPIGCLDVEASIATNFFTTPFFDICPDKCAYLQLCVPNPDGCLVGEFVPFTDADRGLTNKILDKGFKFAYRPIYYDGRAGILSDWSSLYFLDAKGCFDNSEGFSRCIKFRIPMGNPMVEKIEFYFSENGGLTWFLSETIEKYKKYNSAQQYWYQRDLSEDISTTFNSEDCTFEYVFCNDKQRIPIDPKLLTRVINPIPREVQGIFRIKDTIAAFNYVLGNCPIDKNEADKFKVDLNCETVTNCEAKFAKVTVRAIIYSSQIPSNTNGYVYRVGGVQGAADDVNDPANFGKGILGHEQVFKDKTRNFIPYIEATNYWGVMEQYRSAPNFTNVTKIGVLSGLQDEDVKNNINGDIDNGNFYVQEYIFTVPWGMKGVVRLASHHQTNGVGTNQNTSTQVIGMLGDNGLKSYFGTKQLTGIDQNIKEMPFDTCNGDVDTFNAFIVDDIISDNGFGYSGYLSDLNNAPVNNALVYAYDVYHDTTDYNGFYYFRTESGSATIGVYVEQDCSTFSEVVNFAAQSQEKAMAHVDYKIPSEDYRDKFFANVDVLVKNCDGSPVNGLRVAISGGKYRTTGTDGIAHFRLRNFNTRNRSIIAYVMDKGNCFTYDCFGNCNPCMPATVSTPLAVCFLGNPTYTVEPTSRVNTSNLSVNKRGLKGGGNYPFGIVVEGDCGKLSAVIPIKYLYIPKVQETGGRTNCEFTFNGNGIQLPEWGNRIKIVRGVNVNPYYLQWVVDDITRTIDGKIVLTIQTLNDYNKQYNFKTNTVYQFLEGDRVEFIANGDGTIFLSNSVGILNYQILSPFNDTLISGVTTDTNYFNQIIINDDGKLDNLKKGAVIEIQGSTSSEEQLTYREICASIPLKKVTNPDGSIHTELEVSTGTFETFDTYLINRQIQNFPPQYFESKTPSDFWGGGSLDDLGKAHFINPYENEKRYPRNISINSGTQLNYFGDFIKTLDAEEQGGIIAIAVSDDKLGLAICENDNFLFRISDTFLTLGGDGLVHAASPDNIISSPEVKVRGQYGASYDDIGAIYFGDGFAFFVDSKNNAAIMHNYSVAQMCGMAVNQQTGLPESSCNSFFKKRIRQKASFNATSTNFLDHFRWSVGQNKTTQAIYLTLKSLRNAGVNNAQAVYELPNETICYSPVTDTFLEFVSFTPEGYSELSLDDDNGCSILMFQNTQPFVMPIIPEEYNTFFGISCDWVIGVTMNKFQDKVKIPLAIEIQSDKMFFASKVVTDQPGFISEVPPIRVKESNGKWNFAFLNNVNSKGGLYNGKNARGYFTDVLLVRDNTVNLVYNSINIDKQKQYSEIDQIIIKFELVEQSGFTANV